MNSPLDLSQYHRKAILCVALIDDHCGRPRECKHIHTRHDRICFGQDETVTEAELVQVVLLIRIDQEDHTVITHSHTLANEITQLSHIDQWDHTQSHIDQ